MTDPMEHQSTAELAKTVASNLETDRIFQLHNPEDPNLNHLVLLVQETGDMKFSEIEAFLKTTGTDVLFTVFKVRDAKVALSNGNVYLHNVCQEENQLYKNPQARNLPNFPSEKLMDWKNGAQEQFDKTMKRTYLFIEGVDFYKEREPDLAAFMLHQAAELTYRALEVSILGKEKRSHSISFHQSFLSQHLPQLGIHFPANSDEDLKLLKIFEKAYIDSRYRENFHFPTEYIGLIQERVIALQKQAKNVFEQMLEIFEKKAYKLSILEATIRQETFTEMKGMVADAGTLQPELQVIVDLLLERTAPDQIFIFGGTACELLKGNIFCSNEAIQGKSFHYDILVLTALDRPYTYNLQNFINSESCLNVKVRLFFHPREEALTKLERGNRFFGSIYKYGRLIYSRVAVVRHSDIPVPGALERIKKTIYRYEERNKRAAILFDTALQNVNCDADIALSLVAQSLEQKLLGIIYLLSGYAPNLHTLNHLTGICTMLWQETENYLSGTDEDKAALSLLANSTSNIRYSTRNKVQKDRVTTVFSVYRRFAEAAEKKCKRTVESLRKEMEESSSSKLIAHE